MYVHVHPNSRIEKHEHRDMLHVWVKAPAVDGKANKAVITYFKKHFKQKIEIVSGHTQKIKRLKYVPTGI